VSIAFGGIVALFFRGLNLVVALGLVGLCSYELEKGDYGRFVLGLTFVGIVNAATGGLTAATAYQVANQRRAPGEALANGGLLGGGLGLVAIAGGLLAGSWLTGGARAEALAVGTASAAVVLNSVVAGVFLGREAFVRYNLALVCPPLFALLAIAGTFFVLGERSPGAALWAYAGGWWAALVLLAGSGGMAGMRRARLEAAMAGAIGRFALLAGVASGISYLNYRADLFVVRHFEGDGGVAVYSLAVYLAESTWQVSGSLALATYARVGALSRAEAAALTARVMRHTVVLLGMICGALFVASWGIEAVIFPKYEGMGSALRFILPGVLLYGLAQSFSGFYTYQRGLPWVSAVVAGSGLALDMVFAFLLVPRMGVDGAALASALAYSLAILGGLSVFMRQEGLGPAAVFAFGRSELEDYRRLLSRLRAGLVRAPG
jgi:O-antigen/teichoic acid export membrane protein